MQSIGRPGLECNINWPSIVVGDSSILLCIDICLHVALILNTALKTYLERVYGLYTLLILPEIMSMELDVGYERCQRHAEIRRSPSSSLNNNNLNDGGRGDEDDPRYATSRLRIGVFYAGTLLCN